MKWYHNDYSQEALEEMQREAEQRVRESRERARLISGTAFPQESALPQNKSQEHAASFRQNANFNSGGFSAQQQHPVPSHQGGAFLQNCPAASPPLQQGGAFPQSPFSALSEMLGGFGSDKLIILAVLWLLWNEHADAKLLLALIYIML